MVGVICSFEGVKAATPFKAQKATTANSFIVKY